MKTRPSLRSLALAAVLFTGCAHDETVLLQDATAFPPLAPTPDVATIRREAVYKAYPVGRYVDSSDPAVMHEGHVLYVEEAPSRWNLEPNAPVHVPLGPAVTVPDPTRAHPPTPEEWQLELRTQRQATQRVQEQAARLNQTLDTLSSTLPLTRNIAEHTESLLQQQKVTDQRLKQLEDSQARTPAPAAPGSLTVSNPPPTNGLPPKPRIDDW